MPLSVGHRGLFAKRKACVDLAKINERQALIAAQATSEDPTVTSPPAHKGLHDLEKRLLGGVANGVSNGVGSLLSGLLGFGAAHGSTTAVPAVATIASDPVPAVVPAGSKPNTVTVEPVVATQTVAPSPNTPQPQPTQPGAGDDQGSSQTQTSGSDNGNSGNNGSNGSSGSSGGNGGAGGDNGGAQQTQAPAATPQPSAAAGQAGQATPGQATPANAPAATAAATRGAAGTATPGSGAVGATTATNAASQGSNTAVAQVAATTQTTAAPNASFVASAASASAAASRLSAAVSAGSFVSNSNIHITTLANGNVVAISSAPGDTAVTATLLVGPGAVTTGTNGSLGPTTTDDSGALGNKNGSSGHSLSAGIIAGITIGVILLTFLIATLIMFRRRNLGLSISKTPNNRGFLGYGTKYHDDSSFAESVTKEPLEGHGMPPPIAVPKPSTPTSPRRDDVPSPLARNPSWHYSMKPGEAPLINLAPDRPMRTSAVVAPLKLRSSRESISRTPPVPTPSASETIHYFPPPASRNADNKANFSAARSVRSINTTDLAPTTPTSSHSPSPIAVSKHVPLIPAAPASPHYLYPSRAPSIKSNAPSPTVANFSVPRSPRSPTMPDGQAWHRKGGGYTKSVRSLGQRSSFGSVGEMSVASGDWPIPPRTPGGSTSPSVTGVI